MVGKQKDSSIPFGIWEQIAEDGSEKRVGFISIIGWNRLILFVSPLENCCFIPIFVASKYQNWKYGKFYETTRKEEANGRRG